MQGREPTTAPVGSSTLTAGTVGRWVNRWFVAPFIPGGRPGVHTVEEERRARVVVLSAWAGLFWGPFFAAAYHALTGSWLLTIGIFVASLLGGLTPLLLRWTGSYRLSGNWGVFVMFAVLVWLSVQTGFLAAPAVAWLCAVPVFALILHGRDSAFVWLGVVCVTFVGFVFLMSETPSDSEVLSGDRRTTMQLLGLGSLAVLLVQLLGLQAWLSSQLTASVRAQQRETEAIIEQAGDGIVIVDRTGRIVGVNRAFEALTDTRRSTICGSPVEVYLPEPTAEGRRCARRQDGVEVPVEVSRATLDLDASDHAQSVMVVRDLRDRERLETMRGDRDRALDASAAKSAFLANMSHELRTPLNAVIGYGELVLEESLATGDMRFERELTRIVSSGQHLLSLIDRVLDLSKIESGRVELTYREVRLSELLVQAEDAVRPQVASRENQLSINNRCPIEARITTDEVKVRQTLIILLANAAKFTAEGNITLEVSFCDDPAVGDAVMFVVSDTGTGIAEEKLARIFEPFTQADEDVARTYGGTGLGLAVARRFCAMLGGRIDVESELGQGTTFTVILPRAPVETESGEATHARMP